jgi:hypothetical protein
MVPPMRRALPFVIAAVVLAVLVIAVVALSGSEDAPTATSPTGPPQTAVFTVATEFAYTPDLWLAVPDTPIEVTMDNQGSVEHDWTILSESIDNESEFAEDLVLFRLYAEAGDVVEGVTQPLPAGTYQVICTIPGHFTAGQEGILRVTTG